MHIRMMTVVQRQQDLHEVVPDRIFGYRSVVFLGLFDCHRKVPASAVFHQNVENAGIAIDVAVVVAYNMFVMQVFEDVTMAKSIIV
jgi:hypothetical protein